MHTHLVLLNQKVVFQIHQSFVLLPCSDWWPPHPLLFMQNTVDDALSGWSVATGSPEPSIAFIFSHVHRNCMAYWGRGKNRIGNESPAPPLCSHSSWALTAFNTITSVNKPYSGLNADWIFSLPIIFSPFFLQTLQLHPPTIMETCICNHCIFGTHTYMPRLNDTHNFKPQTKKERGK